MGMELVPFYSTLVEAAKSLVSLDIIGHGKVLYQKPRLKSMAQSMVHGVYSRTRIAHNVLAQCTVPTQRKQSIVLS